MRVSQLVRASGPAQRPAPPASDFCLRPLGSPPALGTVNDEDKRRALVVLITLARSGRAHKELMTAPPYSVGDAALSLVLRVQDPRAHEHIVELLTELGNDNPRFAPHLLNRTLAVLGSRSAHCACTAAKAVKNLLPEAHPTQRRPGDEVTVLTPPPMGAIVGAAMGLLRHRDEEARDATRSLEPSAFRTLSFQPFAGPPVFPAAAATRDPSARWCLRLTLSSLSVPSSNPRATLKQLLQVTVDLLLVVSQYDGGGATAVSALLPYLSGAQNATSPGQKRAPSSAAAAAEREAQRVQSTNVLQANATRVLAAVAPVVCKTDLLVASLLLGEDVIYDLMVPLANFDHPPSQVAAVVCINALMNANGGERVAINLTMATSKEMMSWLLRAKEAPLAAIESCPDEIRLQLEHGAAAGKAKREHVEPAERPQGLSIEEALEEALAVRCLLLVLLP